MQNSAKPFRYEEKSVEDDFELVNVVATKGHHGAPSNYQPPTNPYNNQTNNGILSTATSRLSLSLTSPVITDHVDEVGILNNSRSFDSGVVEYNFRPDFEIEYIKRTEELMKREEEEEKTGKAKFIAMLEELNSTKSNYNKEVIPQNNFNTNNTQSSSSFPSLSQSINQLVNIPFSSPEIVTNNAIPPSSSFNDFNNGFNNTTRVETPNEYTTVRDSRQSTPHKPPTTSIDSYNTQPTYSSIPIMNNSNPMLGFSTEEEVECYFNVLEVYKYPGFSTELARFATEAYRGEQLKVFDFCEKYRQLSDMHFTDKDIKEVLLLTDRSFEQSLDMLVNQKSNSFPTFQTTTANKYTNM